MKYYITSEKLALRKKEQPSVGVISVTAESSGPAFKQDNQNILFCPLPFPPSLPFSLLLFTFPHLFSSLHSPPLFYSVPFLSSFSSPLLSSTLLPTPLPSPLSKNTKKEKRTFFKTTT